MAIQWHQKEEFIASQDGHFVLIQPMNTGPGYSAVMRHLNDDGQIEMVLIPAQNADGNWTTGTPFETVEEAKMAAEKFLVEHLALPLEKREEHLVEMMKPRGPAPLTAAQAAAKTAPAGSAG